MTILANGGNAKLSEYFEQYEVSKETPILFKYNTKAAQRYREELLAKVSKLQLEQPSLAVCEGSQLCEGISLNTFDEQESQPTLITKFREYATHKLNKSKDMGNSTYR